MTDFLTEARALSDELAELRHALHREPELGNHEYKTAERIEAYLRSLGIETRRVLDTAVVGVLRGGLPGPTAALRADMDALPIQEATGAAFSSEITGVMHACGHDIHMTAVLGAAKLLSFHRDTLPGAVVFLFQPDEEGDGGAERLIEAGALDGVDAVFGAHVAPGLPLGTVGVRYGKFYAASDMFRIVMTGRSCHGAEREKGVDALAAAAALVPELLDLPGKLSEQGVVTVGTFHAGTAVNIVPGSAELTGIIRTLGPDARRDMRMAVTEAVMDVGRRFGAEPSLELRASYPGVVNDDGMTALAEAAAQALLGAENVRRIASPTMTSEDFGCYLKDRPGTFYHIGAGCPKPLHSADFLPADDAAVFGAAMHAAVITAFFKSKTV